jgi:hypothetical protein
MEWPSSSASTAPTLSIAPYEEFLRKVGDVRLDR